MATDPQGAQLVVAQVGAQRLDPGGEGVFDDADGHVELGLALGRPGVVGQARGDARQKLLAQPVLPLPRLFFAQEVAAYADALDGLAGHGLRRELDLAEQAAQ